jgi:glycosyltransferase involved in cell wall biosynthesis
VKLLLVSEGRQGLTWARVQGIQAATHETVILCDDDNWLLDSYAERAYKLLKSHPDVGLAGGCSIAVPEVEPPFWFESVSGGWALGQHEYVGYLIGDDAFLRRRLRSETLNLS